MKKTIRNILIASAVPPCCWRRWPDPCRRIPRCHQRKRRQLRHTGGPLSHDPARRRPGPAGRCDHRAPGIYRERINPPRGGESDAKRIVYQAAAGEKVEIKGSEVVKNWVQVQGDVWKVDAAQFLLRHFNPYSDLIHGDWFDPKGRQHHTGAVYLNGEWLTEAAKLDDVLKPTAATPLWFAEVDSENTTIWAQFQGSTPMSSWWRSTSAARCSIPISRASTTSPCAALHCGTRPPLGAADGRADRTDRHPLEQRLDHREQHDQSLDLLGSRAGEIWRPVG